MRSYRAGRKQDVARSVSTVLTKPLPMDRGLGQGQSRLPGTRKGQGRAMGTCVCTAAPGVWKGGHL